MNAITKPVIYALSALSLTVVLVIANLVLTAAALAYVAIYKLGLL